MAYTTVNKSTDYFNTSLWTGTGSDPLTVTGVGFQADWTWIKRRELNHHRVMDSVRGATYELYSDVTSAQYGESQGLKSWNTDGYVLGNNAGYNANAGTYAGWSWKAGTTSGLSGGTITPSAYSINTTSKFGIYKYTGNGSSSQTIAHGLGGTPTCVLFKQTSGTEQWRVHFMKAPNPYSKMLILNSNVSESSQTNGLSAVSSTTITFGSDGAYNLNGETYICYVFCDVPGYSKFGKYIGNGNSDGTFVYTGFKPAFIMQKKTSGTSDWVIYDNKRDTSNVVTQELKPNSNAAEGSNTNIDILSNGFKQRADYAYTNNSGGTYVYMAFGQSLVGSNNVPCTAR